MDGNVNFHVVISEVGSKIGAVADSFIAAHLCFNQKLSYMLTWTRKSVYCKERINNLAAYENGDPLRDTI